MQNQTEENNELDFEIENLDDTDESYISVMELAQRQMQALLDEEAETESKPKAEKLPVLSDMLNGLEMFEASPKALAKTESVETEQDNHPLRLLTIGQCYVIALSSLQTGQIARIRSAVAMWANRNGGKYTVISHKEHDLLEIARIG